MVARILVVDDEERMQSTLKELLTSKGYEVQCATTVSEALALLRKRLAIDLVLLDVHLPDGNGVTFLQQIKNEWPEIAVMLMTGFGTIQQSVEAMRAGASDYILKPFQPDEIFLRVGKILEQKVLHEKASFFEKKAAAPLKAFVKGPNRVMQQLYQELEIIATSQTRTVLISGETGTGKEGIAHALHQLSSRSAQPFIAVNATALNAELLESELFGHEEGSFTGASRTKKGLFELAHNGTLFLDEMGDMELALQAKLLRVLEERSIRRVGGTEQIAVDVRVIVATHRNLEEGVAAGTFRQDLYYRLNIMPLRLPPLRERKEDLPTLIHHFIQTFNQEFGRKVETLTPEALKLLQDYNWPGNVRELRNVLERAVLLSKELKEIGLAQLPPLMQRPTLSHASKLGQAVTLELIEKEHIQAVLQRAHGNKFQAAQILGIDRSTLYNKLKKYGLQA